MGQRAPEELLAIETKTKSVRSQKIVKLIEDNARAHMYASVFEIKTGDLAVVARKVSDQSLANRIPDQARAGTPRRDAKACICRRADDEACLLRDFRQSDVHGFDLIN